MLARADAGLGFWTGTSPVLFAYNGICWRGRTPAGRHDRYYVPRKEGGEFQIINVVFCWYGRRFCPPTGDENPSSACSIPRCFSVQFRPGPLHNNNRQLVFSISSWPLPMRLSFAGKPSGTKEKHDTNDLQNRRLFAVHFTNGEFSKDKKKKKILHSNWLSKMRDSRLSVYSSIILQQWRRQWKKTSRYAITTIPFIYFYSTQLSLSDSIDSFLIAPLVANF